MSLVSSESTETSPILLISAPALLFLLQSDRLMKTLTTVAIIVGIIFLSLSIVALTLYSHNPVTNTALINLCINLLLFLVLSLIKTLFLTHIYSQVSFIIFTFHKLLNSVFWLEDGN